MVPCGTGVCRASEDLPVQAVHEDAQYATEDLTVSFRGHPLATEEEQITFVSALTAAAFGLAATGGIDYAWNSYGDALRNGTFYNARRK